VGLLDGRTALITGGSRGLGRALCATLAREGANVAFNYTHSDEDAEATGEPREAMDAYLEKRRPHFAS